MRIIIFMILFIPSIAFASGACTDFKTCEKSAQETDIINVSNLYAQRAIGYALEDIAQAIEERK